MTEQGKCRVTKTLIENAKIWVKFGTSWEEHSITIQQEAFKGENFHVIWGCGIFWCHQQAIRESFLHENH